MRVVVEEEFQLRYDTRNFYANIWYHRVINTLNSRSVLHAVEGQDYIYRILIHAQELLLDEESLSEFITKDLPSLSDFIIVYLGLLDNKFTFHIEKV